MCNRGQQSERTQGVWGSPSYLLGRGGRGGKGGWKAGLESDLRALGCIYNPKFVLYFIGIVELPTIIEQGRDRQSCISEGQRCSQHGG